MAGVHKGGGIFAFAGGHHFRVVPGDGGWGVVALEREKKQKAHWFVSCVPVSFFRTNGGISLTQVFVAVQIRRGGE